MRQQDKPFNEARPHQTPEAVGDVVAVSPSSSALSGNHEVELVKEPFRLRVNIRLAQIPPHRMSSKVGEKAPSQSTDLRPDSLHD